MILLVVLLGAAVVMVPLTRGNLSRLTTLRFVRVPALLIALVGQYTIGVIVPESDPRVLALVHILTYVSAFVFVWANRRVPGLWLIGLGGVANFVAIAANFGVMPATAAAWEAAGLPAVVDGFSNTAVLPDPRLVWLGDVFAIPPPFPFANVFSVGDVLLLAGAMVALHRICESRLVPSGAGQFTELVRHGRFARLWSAQCVSNLGDWTYALAVASYLATQPNSSQLLALVLVVQVAPAALVGLLGGPLIDRANRRTVLLVADVARALAVASLLFAGGPSTAHLFVVAGILGLFGALSQPALHASLPNLVPANRLVAANSAVSASQHLAIMVGPVLGGLLVANLGGQWAVGINAASFAVSAVVVLTVRLRSTQLEGTPVTPVADLVEGFRHAATTPLVRGVMVTIGLVVFAAAVRQPLEALFVLELLGRDPTALGLVGGAWGLGMVLGSLAAPAAARRWPRESLFACSIALVGVAVLAASQATVLNPVLVFWLAAGLGNAMGTVAYESLLQERTADVLRGRVLSAVEAVIQVAFLGGALAAGWLGGQIGLRGSYVVSGLLFLLAAVCCRRLLPGHVQRSLVLVEPDLAVAEELSERLQAAGYAVDRAEVVKELDMLAKQRRTPRLVVVRDRADRAAVRELRRRTPSWRAVGILERNPHTDATLDTRIHEVLTARRRAAPAPPPRRRNTRGVPARV